MVTSIGWNAIAMADERINAFEKSPCAFMAVDKHCPTQYNDYFSALPQKTYKTEVQH
jgi:hypothetical protein